MCLVNVHLLMTVALLYSLKSGTMIPPALFFLKIALARLRTFPSSLKINSCPFCSLSSPAPAAAAAKSLQSCPTLCDPIDSSPPGSPDPGILQARTLEWVAISFSKAWKWKVKMKSLSHVWLVATLWTAAYQAPPSWDFPGKSTGVGCHCLLQWKDGEFY